MYYQIQISFLINFTNISLKFNIKARKIKFIIDNLLNIKDKHVQAKLGYIFIKLLNF